MKIKGISVWEQHVDKLVLLVAALVFAGFAAWQLMGTPNTTDIGPTKRTPGQVDAYLVSKAQDLLGRMSDNAPAEIEINPPPPMADVIDKRLKNSVSPPGDLKRISYDVRLPIEGPRATGKEYFVPRPGAPVRVMVAQYEDAILAEEVQKHEGLALAIGRDSEPFDLQFTTPAAQFAERDFIRQLQGEGLPSGPDDPAKVPSVWHNDRNPKIDLVVQRQEMLGEKWSDPIEIATLPGRLSYRDILDQGAISAQQRDEILTRLADPAGQREIIQPEFYLTKSDTWLQPDFNAPELKEGEEENAEIRTVLRNIESVRKDLLRVEQRLKDNDCPDEPPPAGGGENPKTSQRSSGRSGGTAAPGGGAEGGGTSTAKGSEGDPAKDMERKCRPLWRARTGHLEKLADLDARLARLRGQDQPKPAHDTDSDNAEMIDVWAHDINVQPGKTYRYRMMIKVFNPFFGKKHNLVENQQRLAEKFTLDSEFSEWSGPIRIRDARQFFVSDVTPASQQGQLAGEIPLGRANIEVARFHDGGWHMERFAVAPGDRLGEKKTIGGRGGEPAVTIDFTTEWFVVDIIEQPGESGAGRDASGIVILQSLVDGRRVVRDPRQDSKSPVLQEIRDRISSAKLASLP